MKKIAVALIFISSLPLFTLGQIKNLKNFTISGEVNVDTGTVQLIPNELNKALYPTGFKPIIAKIIKGKFKFNGQIDEPVWMYFKIGDKYQSAGTAISTGGQRISIDTASNYGDPINDNLVMKDAKSYDKAFMIVENQRKQYKLHYDSLFNIYGRKFPEELELKSMKELKATYIVHDATLLSFVKENPNSYYALYKLYALLNFGYNTTLGNTFEHFPTLLKTSRLGQATLQRILSLKQIAIGETLPNFNVFNLKGEKIADTPYNSNKLTLVDMWYSHCMPCIAQFEDLKAIRNAFQDKGFEIIGISTDKTKYVEDWKLAIDKYKLTWPQYLDLNGIETSKYGIHIFPTSLLVNQQGKIVATGLSTVELKDFLKNNL
ncbi:AhpC/TSA family protein [Pedobacter sp. MR2016-19]|uniref:TlpA disulfide reductase family protein n=1 Tax=Pedobacter sp. MR2016-19 TaxID=2780089 RepID=UPI00187563BE|nr:TlpA disulfide reductase family protein [Pedobacter sp. MR2016-19]MBE5318269.1 AhpC/TSA family protein [Pedobacter sp. MR2016-19]